MRYYKQSLFRPLYESLIMDNEWMEGLIEKLKDYDVISLVEMLELKSSDIVEMFEYDIEEKAEQLAEEIGYTID